MQKTRSDPYQLPYRKPYDWASIIGFLKARAIPGVERVSDECYARTFEIAGAHGLIVVEPARGGALSATIRAPGTTPVPSVLARLRRLFDLDADPGAIAAHLSKDELLAPLISARPGLRVPGAWDGFELAVRATLGQQITVKGARQLAGKLVAVHGDPLSISIAGAGELTHVFPRPERLVRADLRALGMPRARARTLALLAAAVHAEPGIFGTGLDACIARLRSIPGIGEWTAQYIAMRELRDPDAFPAGDVGIRRALAAAMGNGSPSSREILTRAEHWRPWRAYAAQHLWASLGT